MLRSRTTCRGCNSDNLFEFLNLGSMPLAGGFLKKEDVPHEVRIPLRVNYCRNCTLVQILDIVDPEVLFQNYKYISSVIPSLVEHFKQYSNYLEQHYLKPGSKLLEFGCNDGVLLQTFAGKNVSAYGIDPSRNVSQMARDKGLHVWTGYFDRQHANKIKQEIGEVDVVTGSNVFAHTDDVREIIEAAKIVLKKSGVFVVEVHYLKDLLDLNQYDTIYHEHLTYYTVTSLQNIFALAGMDIVDVHHLPMHGGAIRVFAQHREHAHRKPAVMQFIEEEKDITEEKLLELGHFAARHKNELVSLLHKLKKEGKTVVGYGAPGRATTLLNYCHIDGKLLDYIVDASPLRAGLLMPGVHIEIKPVEDARKAPPDYFLVLAWNYADAIMKKEQALTHTQFILPFPEIEIRS